MSLGQVQAGQLVVGKNLISSGSGNIIVGEYNSPDASSLLQLGTGISEGTRQNAINVTNSNLDLGVHIIPTTNSIYDIGSAEYKIRHLYLSNNSMYIGDSWIKSQDNVILVPEIQTGDLHLSNENKSNSIDGTWGKWTFQEGEDDLFIINKRNGKKYKFNLTEVN